MEEEINYLYERIKEVKNKIDNYSRKAVTASNDKAVSDYSILVRDLKEEKRLIEKILNKIIEI